MYHVCFSEYISSTYMEFQQQSMNKTEKKLTPVTNNLLAHTYLYMYTYIQLRPRTKYSQHTFFCSSFICECEEG